jgi:GNAT superfamily N-acetyltransferase
MKIRIAEEQDLVYIIGMIDRFRIALARLRRRPAESDPAGARVELEEYLAKKFPIYIAEEDRSGIVAYMVCRIDGDIVWLESIFVEEEFRRKGVASQLYCQAERLAHELGGGPPYNWIDPDNEGMIQFLAKRGYDVLNLIELRRREPGDQLARKIRVGDHEYYRK